MPCASLRFRLFVLLVASALVSACGGGGGGSGGGQPEQLAPVASIQFPPQNSLTDEPDIRVLGTAEDLQGDDIAAVRVNGIDATSNDGFATWEVALSLEPGENRLFVETLDAAGNSAEEADTATVQLKAVPFLSNPGEDGLLIDPANFRAIVIDSILDALFAFDLATGERTVLSSNGAVDKFLNQEPVGQGPVFRNPSNLVPGSETNQVIVNDQIEDQFLAIDVTTGERSVLLHQTRSGGSGPAFRLLRSGIMDVEHNRFLVMDGFNGDMRVFGVDLDTKNRTLLSGSGVGSGPGLNVAENLVLDSENSRLYLTDIVNSTSARLLVVNLNTGQRQIVSDGTEAGSGPLFTRPVSLDFDPATNNFLIADEVLDALFTVDPNTGNREVVSGDIPGTNERVGGGADFKRPKSAAFLGSQQAVVVENDIDVPIVVDLTTGDRQLIPNNAIGEGPRMETPRSMVRVGNKLLVADSETNQLLSVSLASGDRQVVLEGRDSLLNEPRSLALDTEGGRLFVIDNIDDDPRVLSFDLESQEIAVVSGAGIGEGDALLTPDQLAFDPISGLLYLVDISRESMLSIDPATGNRTEITTFENRRTVMALTDNNQEALVVSGGAMFRVNLGTGEQTFVSGTNPDTGDVVGIEFILFDTSSMVFDAKNNRALLGNFDEESIVAVDLATGASERVSELDLGVGPFIDEPISLSIDEENQNLLVLDSARRAVLTVNPENGDRVIISWTDFSPQNNLD